MTRSQLLFGFIAGSVAVIGAAVVGCSEDPTSLSSSGNPSSSSGASGDGSSGGTSSGAPAPVVYKAKATIASTGPADAGSKLSGTVEFVETDGTTKITVKMQGGVPGDHGLHIHEVGDCGDAGMAAGGHWNPADAGHGFPNEPEHHLGDLGNVLINSDGTGSTVKTSTELAVKDGPSSVVGRAVIYHDKHDDGTGAVGNAGARPGCGVIVKE